MNVESLLDGLRRFGLPAGFIDMVAGIMMDRQFYVEEWGSKSALRRLRSGITQGCALSPLLFIMAMTVLMKDALELLPQQAREAYAKGDLSDIAYADDTLLLAVSSAHLEQYLRAVEAAGKRFGLELHHSKFQLLQVLSDDVVHLPSGEPLTPMTSMEYLGATVAQDGQVGSELHRRIGIAKGEFRALQKVWNHAAVSLQRKLYLYRSLVETKLLYALASTCLTKAQDRQLDGFQARCLRKILRIPPAFISRVSNAEVLRRSGQTLATVALQTLQLSFLGKVIRSPEGSLLKTVSFVPGTLQTAAGHYIRRVGRPRKEWITSVLPEALRRVQGNGEQLAQLAQDASVWRAFLHSES